jgi:hypothetical protein
MKARGCGKTRRAAKSTPRALKRRHIFNDLTARVTRALPKPCFEQSFSSTSKLVPFPKPALIGIFPQPAWGGADSELLVQDNTELA